ncbi:unnamed protein product [Adineta steineri]|uniref:Transmembrane protein n=1 Tax=Adineta steineri TaxID=433720 RepID=A0A815H1S7_9BILA|nr:unnamed protein product [Adineta steineri]CAF1346311.1 unnamed protein product [Adineta steineri]
MGLALNNTDLITKLNKTVWHSSPKKNSQHYKSFTFFQIIEICLLILILLEHTFVFIVTFQKKSSKKSSNEQNQCLLLLPSKTLLYCCLHRNWIRAFSFTNMCLSIVYFIKLLLKHYHPNLVHHSSITFYSLPLNLLQQILMNFSTFHLFIISISVLQYFLRYYCLRKNTYSSYFFNGQSLLLTKHTNVALILSGSLALIFAYNFIFYTPKHPQTITLLPLVTFNMILLPLINFIIFSFIFICLILNISFKSKLDYLQVDNEQENLRLMVEKKTCIKCYSKILRKNSNLFQDNNYSYRHLYKHFFPTGVRPSYPFQTKSIYLTNNKPDYSQTDFSYQHQKDLENNSTNSLSIKTTLIQLKQQHSLCHICHCLLLIFLFKYILFTFPQYILQMLFHLKQFYQLFFKHNLSNNITYSLYEDHELLLRICHYLFLLSRFGDSFLLIRISYIIKKYFPCWCHFNSKLLRKQELSHQILTMKTSVSSNNEGISAGDLSNSNESPNEIKQQELIENTHWKRGHRRFRLRFQFIPLWSNHRPRLFKEII